MSPLRILHAHSTFSLGGKEARAVRLMNAWGGRARHVVLSATEDFGAREAIGAGVAVEFPSDAPSLTGKPSPGRYLALARYMRAFDLVLTYNWGAMDVVMARRCFGGPALVHHEDGFNADEAEGQKTKRVWFRRVGLGGCHAVVVPSLTLERIAGEVWRQPAERVRRIANGVPVARYAAPEIDFGRRDGEVIVGTVAGLRAVKDLGRLIDAVAALPSHVRLVIVGEGPERGALEAKAAALGPRVSFAGFMDRPWRFVGGFDVLALSSLSEQQPIAVIEAMAAGLPVVSTDVGDVAQMVAAANRPYVTSDGYAAALARVTGDAALRAAVGAANRARAAADYDEAAMIAAYARLYGEAAGRPGSLGAI